MEDDPKRILGIHFGLLLAEAICISAFLIEIHRALVGNTLSWAYVFEWPIFAMYAVYLWRKLLHDERHASESSLAPMSESDDHALSAYNEYLDKVHGAEHDNGTDTT